VQVQCNLNENEQFLQLGLAWRTATQEERLSEKHKFNHYLCSTVGYLVTMATFTTVHLIENSRKVATRLC